MAALPLDPPLARAILAADELGCFPEMCAVAGMLSAERVFLRRASGVFLFVLLRFVMQQAAHAAVRRCCGDAVVVMLRQFFHFRPRSGPNDPDALPPTSIVPAKEAVRTPPSHINHINQSPGLTSHPFSLRTPTHTYLQLPSPTLTYPAPTPPPSQALGDFVVYLRLFQAWERAGRDRDFCKDHRLNVRSINTDAMRPCGVRPCGVRPCGLVALSCGGSDDPLRPDSDSMTASHVISHRSTLSAPPVLQPRAMDFAAEVRKQLSGTFSQRSGDRGGGDRSDRGGAGGGGGGGGGNGEGGGGSGRPEDRSGRDGGRGSAHGHGQQGKGGSAGSITDLRKALCLGFANKARRNGALPRPAPDALWRSRLHSRVFAHQSKTAPALSTSPCCTSLQSHYFFLFPPPLPPLPRKTHSNARTDCEAAPAPQRLPHLQRPKRPRSSASGERAWGRGRGGSRARMDRV